MSLPTSSFGSVCHLVNGKAFKPTDWSGAGVPIIRIQNLNGPDKPFNYWAGALGNQVVVKTGDLLLAWSGTPGTSFGAHIWSGPNGILNQHIFRCDLDQKAITKEWARIAVNHRLYRLIEQAHGGVGLQHVTRGMVEDLEIPLPPLAEQRRIAEVLDRAEALRAKRRAALAQLDSLTQSLFLDLFGDPLSNPKAWSLRKLHDVLDLITYGLTVRPEYVSIGIPLISAKEIRGGTVAVEMAAKISQEDFDRLSHKAKPVTGDVLFSKTGSIGHTAVVTSERPIALAQNVARLTFKQKLVDQTYALQYFRTDSIQDFAQRSGRGNAVKDLQLGVMEQFPFPLPPLELQQDFARRVRAVEKLKTAQRASLAEMDALFAALQYRAFRGEL